MSLSHARTHTHPGVWRRPKIFGRAGQSSQKGSSLVESYHKCTRALTFADFCQCDSGDGAYGGCSAECTIQHGWDCNDAEPTVCQEVCGNGLISSGETCDDGNSESNDGCSASCLEEHGWVCNDAEPQTCEEVCENGLISPSEMCDDGNAKSGDGCSSSCSIGMSL